MHDRQHGVGLAATEGGLQLDDRVAAIAGQALGHRREQGAHALGDEGALEEQHRVLVLRRGGAVMDTGDVGRELGTNEGAPMDILVRDGDFAPGLQVGHSTSL